MTREIHVTPNLTAVVDDEDYGYPSQFRWHRISRGYAGRRQYNSETKKQTLIYMHREIMNASAGADIDHVNGVKLDNRRTNLRFATRSENMRNMAGYGASPFKGVSRPTKSAGWIVTFPKADGIQRHYGTFQDEVVAARVYDAYVAVAGDPFLRFNFPNEPHMTMEEADRLRVQHKLLRPDKLRKTSRYHGVSYYKVTHKWRAAIMHERVVHIGYFHDELEAARAYDRKALELFGPITTLNFPQEVSL